LRSWCTWNPCFFHANWKRDNQFWIKLYHVFAFIEMTDNLGLPWSKIIRCLTHFKLQLLKLHNWFTNL
jgi:hypothetical protein